jgi:hypothetical protein
MKNTKYTHASKSTGKALQYPLRCWRREPQILTHVFLRELGAGMGFVELRVRRHDGCHQLGRQIIS